MRASSCIPWYIKAKTSYHFPHNKKKLDRMKTNGYLRKQSLQVEPGTFHSADTAVNCLAESSVLVARLQDTKSIKVYTILHAGDRYLEPKLNQTYYL